MNTIDLRSDTVTLPTDEMREAIARAALGDDVYGEDPTVNQLERIAAAIMGKQAAMLVPSGTMGNLAAMLAHCPRGTKALLGSQAHTYAYEGGSAEFIAKARRILKVLGGGMRQAGIIAAAGIVALHTMIERMAEDHLNARALAEALSLIAGVEVRPVKRRTNMVVFDIAGSARAAVAFAASLKDRGVLMGARGPTAFRAVTHYGISRADIDRAVAAASEAAAEALTD